ncbi:SMI1/KNR4 family protein [Nocardiopsis chromatogenes]|uniref:SMI1/KNR4 family protein n=1 Tax=Nocardiopsis chromatogenes TaxID=280239 RepID=UPI0003462458|nr:SMI1/KNR4 family protein [Nocardiopsis chromatogenes]
MWRQLIAQECPEAEAAPGAPPDAVAEAERRLGHPLPDPLRSLLLECDGITGAYGIGVVWDSDTVARENGFFRTWSEFRELYMPFGHLLFFGDDGGGDRFALPVDPVKDDVYAWDHEDDSRVWLTGDLETYVRRALLADARGEDLRNPRSAIPESP